MASCRCATDRVPTMAMGAKGWLVTQARATWVADRPRDARTLIARARRASLAESGRREFGPSTGRRRREVAIAGGRPREQPRRVRREPGARRIVAGVDDARPRLPTDLASDNELLHQAIGGQPRDAA